MKILHIIPSYIPAFRFGGAVITAHQLCKHLVLRGHDVSVFTTNNDGPGNLDLPIGVPIDQDGVKVTYCDMNRLRRLYYSRMLSDRLEKEITDYDLLHLHSAYLLPTTTAARMAFKRNVPYIVTPHVHLHKDIIRKKNRFIKMIWIWLFERYNFYNAAGIHAFCKLEVKQITRLGLKINAVEVIAPGINVEPFKKERLATSLSIGTALNHRKFILYVGRISYEKGLDRLIKSMQYVEQIDFVIAGNDETSYQKVLEKLAIAIGVFERIHFVGPVFGDDKIWLFKNAMLAVVPSYYETFGLVTLEAMAAGCPVVVSKDVGAAELVTKYKAGAVTSGEPVALGRTLARLISSSDQREEMGRFGRKAAMEHFSWNDMANKMEKFYQTILG